MDLVAHVGVWDTGFKMCNWKDEKTGTWWTSRIKYAAYALSDVQEVLNEPGWGTAKSFVKESIYHVAIGVQDDGADPAFAKEITADLEGLLGYLETLENSGIASDLCNRIKRKVFDRERGL